MLIRHSKTTNSKMIYKIITQKATIIKMIS
nr:MAG TPA: hypothetical protein [Caudoviricetes sp.]